MTSSFLKVLSPAKLNLVFSILGKREDGYHEIASVMQAVNLVDILSFQLSTHDHFSCSEPSLVNQDNLVLQALRLFRKKSRKKFSVEIHLEKRIPQMAGLGGGSSNASTTLWALNALTGHSIPETDLSLWAAELGSDTSFFFSSGTALCTSRGEKVRDMDCLSSFCCTIAKPAFSLSTKEVYSHVQLSTCRKMGPEQILQKFCEKEPEYFNDLETSAFYLQPKMLQTKEALLKLGFKTVLMTGSGSAFFCLGDVANPQLPGVEFFSVESIQRKSPNWYSTKQ